MREPIYLRGNVWWARVRNPEGGRRLKVSTGCRDKRAAEAWYVAHERGQVPSSDRPPGPLLSVALEDREDDRRARGRRPGTLHMYGVKGAQLVRVMGDVTIDLVDAAMVDRYVRTRRAERTALSTIHKELCVLRGTLRLQKRWGHYHRDLEEVMPEGVSGTSLPGTRTLHELEVGALLRALPPKRAAVVAVLVATGATYPSEVVRLRRADVDIARGVVFLDGTKRATRRRQVPVPAYALGWLRDALPYLPLERWGNVRRDLIDACARVGIVKCCPTDLRRTYGTLLRRRGVEPSLIGLAMGHADSRQVERVYGRLSPDDLSRLIGDRVGGKAPGRARRAAS